MASEDKVKRTRRGRVVSNKMDKSVSVLLEWSVKHPIYGKYIKRSSKVLAHDESNDCNEGDLVDISLGRPLSKRKCWQVVGVVERSK